MVKSSKKNITPSKGGTSASGPYTLKSVIKAPKGAHGKIVDSSPPISKSGSIDLPRKMDHPMYGELYAVHATDKSYCAYKPDDGSSRKTLIVECSGEKFSRHDRALKDVMIRSCKQSLGKAATVQFRDSIMTI